MARSFSPLSWKKSFRRLPPNVEATLGGAAVGALFVVCGEKVVSDEDLRNRVYRHLNVERLDDIPAEFEPFIPSPTVGSTSFRNATPVEEVQKHLGWISKTYIGRAPSRGRLKMHATRYQRRVRPRLLVPPAMSFIAFKRLKEIPNKGISVFWQITDVLDGSDRSGILRCLNLLQENVGVAELRPIETAEADALRHLNLSLGWEILPHEGGSEALERVYRRLGGRKSDAGLRAQDRLAVLRALNPARTFLSTRGLVGYIAVEFCPSLTIFEHLEIDHAMFVAHGPAEEFIKLRREEMKAKLNGDIERLVHSHGWEERLRRMVKLARGDQSANPGDII